MQAALENELEKIRTEFNAEHAIFGVYNLPDRSSIAATTYADDGIKGYHQIDPGETDPILFLCQRATEPIDWRLAEQFDPHGVIANARKNGIGDRGVSIPLRESSHVFAVLSITKNCDEDAWQDFLSQNTNQLTDCATRLLRLVFKDWKQASQGRIEKLGKRQVEILQLFAEGLTAKEISERLGLSQRTVENHILRIRSRLDASNTHHAVAKAIGMKIIYPS